MPLFRKARQPGAHAGRTAALAATRPALPSSQPALPSSQAALPVIQPLLGDQHALRFQAELAYGRWQSFHEFLGSVSDANDRYFYITGLIDAAGMPAWLGEWVAGRPESALPYLARGSHGVDWAWHARGAGRAAAVSEDAWTTFYARLTAADRDLARAAALDPADPTAHARSIWAAIGLALGQPEIRRRFAQVTQRHPWHQAAHRAMIQALSAKWYGSNDEMFSFARSASAQAPEGSRIHAMIPVAHLEQWLNLPRESADGTDRQSRYFQEPGVQQEIRAAAARSILSPRYAIARTSPSDRNVFAMCFSLMHDHAAVLDQMRQIGPLITADPWHYLGDPAQAYERARIRALEQAGGAAQPGHQRSAGR